MQVKELVALLLKNDQEADVNFQVGHNNDVRRTLAKVVLEDDGTPEHEGMACLMYMDVSQIEQKQYCHSEESEVLITLEQDYYTSVYFDELMRGEKGGDDE